MSLDFGGVESAVGEDEKRMVARTAEDDVDGALGNVDLGDWPSGWVVDEDLAVGDIDIAPAVDGDALAAAVGEGLEIGERAVGVDLGAVGAVLCLAANVDALAGLGGDETVGVEIVGESPAQGVRG